MADFLAGTLSRSRYSRAGVFQLLPENVRSKPWDTLYVGASIHQFLTLIEKTPQTILFRGLSPFLKKFKPKHGGKPIIVLRGDSVEQIMEKEGSNEELLMII